MSENVLDSSPPVLPGTTYTSRPISITAEQWDGTEEHAQKLTKWADSYRGRGSACYIAAKDPTVFKDCKIDGEAMAPVLERPAHISIGTLEGNMKLHAGDWLIKGTEDEFYPCKDSVFQRKYYKQPEPLTQEESSALTQRLYATTDAGVWAHEFCQLNPGVDEGMMIGWFANAIVTAADLERAKRG